MHLSVTSGDWAQPRLVGRSALDDLHRPEIERSERVTDDVRVADDDDLRLARPHVFRGGLCRRVTRSGPDHVRWSTHSLVSIRPPPVGLRVLVGVSRATQPTAVGQGVPKPSPSSHQVQRRLRSFHHLLDHDSALCALCG